MTLSNNSSNSSSLAPSHRFETKQMLKHKAAKRRGNAMIGWYLTPGINLRIKLKRPQTTSHAAEPRDDTPTTEAATRQVQCTGRFSRFQCRESPLLRPSPVDDNGTTIDDCCATSIALRALLDRQGRIHSLTDQRSLSYPPRHDEAATRRSLFVLF